MNQLNLELIALIVGALALVTSITALVFSGKLKRLRQMFDQEHQPDNLEEIITSITDALKKIKSDHNQLAEVVAKNGATLETAFQYSSVVRFDSGGSDGGNLSFALALLDSRQTGFIVTSLHGREHNRIYCKAIIEGASQAQLSEEEQEALIQALTRGSEDKIKKEKAKKKS